VYGSVLVPYQESLSLSSIGSSQYIWPIRHQVLYVESYYEEKCIYYVWAYRMYRYVFGSKVIGNWVISIREEAKYCINRTVTGTIIE
jgi:hypothetical protein